MPNVCHLCAAGITNLDVNTLGQGGQSVLAVYFILEGQYPPRKFAALPSVNTIIGMFKQEDYVVKVFKDETGQLYAQGLAKNNTAKILDVTETCNGVIYKVDQMLLPAENENQISSRFADGIALLQITKNGSRCAVSLPQALGTFPNTQQWVDLWGTTGIIKQLR